ncbi:glycosyltransferase [Ktedonosporobacter rubrisoli]|nr:glycosyltransferase [Ktedonosporobacter rubrisoli]
MRVTILTGGTRGDVQPYVALGQGLQRSGHEVTLATTAQFEPFVLDHGLHFFPLSGDPQEVLEASLKEEGKRATRTGIAARLAAVNTLMRTAMRECYTACQQADAIVFNPITVFACLPIAQQLHLPCMAAYLQPIEPTHAFPGILFPSLPAWLGVARAPYNLVTGKVLDSMRWRMLKKPIQSEAHALLGLSPQAVHNPSQVVREQEISIVYGYSPAVLPKPSDWPAESLVTGYWFLQEEATFQPPADLVRFLEAGPAPVYIGFGSMANPHAEALTREVARSLSMAHQRAVVTTGWGALHHTTWPETVYETASIPHSWLFPRMAATVIHGGAGTVAASLRAGKPTIVIPFLGDQGFWGERVHALGAGPQSIRNTRLTAERLSAAINEAVTDERMRANAAALGEQIRAENGVGQAVSAFNAYLAGHRAQQTAH